MRLSIVCLTAVSLGLAACSTPELQVVERPIASDTPLTCDQRALQPPSYTRADVGDRRAVAESRRQDAGYQSFADMLKSGRAVEVSRAAPFYPQCAISRGLEGTCEVWFDLTPSGRPENIVPICTSVLFERAAIQAVERAEIYVYDENGDSIAFPALAIPLRFALEAKPQIAGD